MLFTIFMTAIIKSKIELFHGDCLEIMKNIPDNSIDMILCDLPYGTTACSWDTVIPFKPLWDHYNRIRKTNTAMVFTASQPFTTSLIASQMNLFRYEWIWEKHQGTNPLTSKIMPLKNHENVCVFYENKPTYNPVMAKGKPYAAFQTKNDKKIGEVYGDNKSVHVANSGTRYPTTILKFAKRSSSAGIEPEINYHPTQKPVSLMEYFIKTYTNPGDTVLDNCMGSGTTGVACKSLNRSFIGIEIDEKYFNIAKNRIDNNSRLMEFYE